MSILIKGMEIPKACYECCMYQADIYYCSAAWRDIDIPDSSEGRCSFCPLVPVPSHGRLIDADKLAEKHRELAYELRGANYDFHMTAKAWVDSAPTIIPAEEGE